MIHVRSIRSSVLASILLLGLGQSGCSVLSAVGGWFSGSYENTVAYFNAYYNAKRLFDEAEAEVLAARSSLRGRTTSAAQPAAAGSTAKQKFTAVIDKCSNVLSFYPKSSVVNDALFLIGKSYFYQEEFVRAERKFTELLAKNPSGKLGLENQLWLLKTLQKLNKYEEANRVGQDLIVKAEDAGKYEIAGEALMILGDIAVSQKNSDIAIDQYTKSVAASGNGEMQATAQMKIGDLYFSIPEYDKAAASYIDVQKFSPDKFTLYDSQLQAAIAYRRSGKYTQSADVLRAMDADYRFIESRGTIRYELARTFEKEGMFEDAADLYQLVDTTNARTEIGSRAAFDLGKLYQAELGNYAKARTAFSHATSGGPPEQSQEATKKVAALDSYFRLQKQFNVLDSILFIYDVDSLWVRRDTVVEAEESESVLPISKTEPSSESTRRGRAAATNAKDTSRIASRGGAPAPEKRDSTRTLPDSSASKGAIVAQSSRQDSVDQMVKHDSLPASPMTIMRRLQKPKKDTLVTSLGKLSYLLGELFYTDLDVPDSTFFWLNQSLKLGIDSLRTPRALYVLAEIARASPGKKYGDEKELYTRVIEKYPKSTYAEEARIAMGFRPTAKKVDPAETVYAAAESLIVAGEYQRALDSLDHIIRDLGESPLVPKSRYTMAFLYENYLSKPDSALSQYTTLAQKFVTTKYGEAAKRRIPPPTASPKGAADSSNKAGTDSLKGMRALEPKKSLRDTARVGQPVPIPRTPADTAGRFVPQAPKMRPDTSDQHLKIPNVLPDTSGRHPAPGIQRADTSSTKANLNPPSLQQAPRPDTLKSEGKKEREK